MGAIKGLLTTRTLVLFVAFYAAMYLLARSGHDPISAGQRARVAA